MKTKNHIPHQLPFKTPANYFEKLEEQIHQKITHQPQTTKTWWLQPALTTLILLLIVIAVNVHQSHNLSTSFIASEEIISYYEETYLPDDDEYLLYEFINPQTNPENEENKLFNYILENDFSEDELLTNL